VNVYRERQALTSPKISLVPSGCTPRATYTALFRTVPSSRIFTRMASKKISA
jgi:hypothetical protein